MTSRKITIDNSVRYVPKSEQTKERVSKPKTTKAGSIPRKQNQKISKNNKSFLNNFSASGFKYITKYYLYKYKNNYVFIHI